MIATNVTMSVRMEVHNGKLYIVHPSGYIAFTWEEWQAAKEAGDDLFGNPDAIPGHVERTEECDGGC